MRPLEQEANSIRIDHRISRQGSDLRPVRIQHALRIAGTVTLPSSMPIHDDQPIGALHSLVAESRSCRRPGCTPSRRRRPTRWWPPEPATTASAVRDTMAASRWTMRASWACPTRSAPATGRDLRSSGARATYTAALESSSDVRDQQLHHLPGQRHQGGAASTSSRSAISTASMTCRRGNITTSGTSTRRTRRRPRFTIRLDAADRPGATPQTGANIANFYLGVMNYSTTFRPAGRVPAQERTCALPPGHLEIIVAADPEPGHALGDAHSATDRQRPFGDELRLRQARLRSRVDRGATSSGTGRRCRRSLRLCRISAARSKPTRKRACRSTW